MRLRKKLQHEDGAAAVEFALISGVLAMLIFGMLQFGLAFFELQNLRAATREGARIGAVRGTVAEIQQRVETYAGIPNLRTSVNVYARTGNTLAGPLAVTAKPCAAGANGITPDSVQAEIPLNIAPPSVQDIFTVDIPLMPTISMLNAKVQGEFRCEV